MSSKEYLVIRQPVEAPHIEVYRDLGAIIKFSDFSTEFIDHAIEVPSALIPLQDEVVRELTQSGVRLRNETNLSLSRWEHNNNGRVDQLHFTYAPATYFHLLATHKSLDRKIADSDLTVRQLYGDLATMITSDGYHRSPYSKQSGVSGVIKTSDNKIILARRSMNVAVEPGSWHVSVAEGMRMNDVDELGRISPMQTFIRGIREEIQDTRHGADKVIANAKITGLGISSKYLQPQFFVSSQTDMTSKEIIQQASRSRGRWERLSIEAVDLDPHLLLNRIFTEQWSPHGAMAILAFLKDEELLG